jgi:hypothetical protein
VRETRLEASYLGDGDPVISEHPLVRARPRPLAAAAGASRRRTAPEALGA